MTSKGPQAALDAFFEWYYGTCPVNATFIGVHQYDHRLPDYSERGVDEMLGAIDALRQRLRDLPPNALTPAEALDRDLAAGFLDVQRWEYGTAQFHRMNPSLYVGEAVFGILSLFLRPFAPLATRVDAAIERMRAIPTLLGQATQNIAAAPQAWIDRAIRECLGALAFFERGAAILAHDERVTHPAFRAAAEAAAAAFHRFKTYLESDLRSRASEAYACGAQGLDLLIRRGHFLNMDAGDVAALATEQMAVCERDLEARAAGLGAAPWREALGRLTEKHPPVEGYYARYQEIWQAARDAADTHGLVSWPDYPIRYVPQPRWAREAAPFLYFLFYRAPAAFDRVPVVDYLVTPIEPAMPAGEQARRLRATNDSVIKLNHVIHHGGLGHHVQNWNAYHRAASRIGQIAAVDCASRIAMSCGGTMAEGWACYAVDLMDEIGFLEPLDRLAQAHTRLRMATRALVDVRLHRGEWTLEQAAACYRDRVGMPAEAARAEAVKNSMFPATALMYLTGTHLIHQLRRDLGRTAGFSLRQFHNRFLSYGSVPVPLICAAMRGEARGKEQQHA